jgi:hypothetical protein
MLKVQGWEKIREKSNTKAPDFASGGIIVHHRFRSRVLAGLPGVDRTKSKTGEILPTDGSASRVPRGITHL